MGLVASHPKTTFRQRLGCSELTPLGAPASNSHVAATDEKPARSDRNFTPPFPAYPSGHATFGAAALHVVRLFYGLPTGNRAADTVFTGPFVLMNSTG